MVALMKCSLDPASPSPTGAPILEGLVSESCFPMLAGVLTDATLAGLDRLLTNYVDYLIVVSAAEVVAIAALLFVSLLWPFAVLSFKISAAHHENWARQRESLSWSSAIVF